MGRTGLEHIAKPPEKTGVYNSSGAESGAVGDEIGKIDPDLRRVTEAWPTLPNDLRKAILAIVEAAKSAQ